MDISKTVNRLSSPALLKVTAVLLLSLCGSGCDSGKHTSQTGIGQDVTASGSPSPAKSIYTDGTAWKETGSGDLAHGGFRIEVSDTGVTIRAEGVNEKEILSSLAKQAGFQLVDAGATWKIVTLNIDATSVHAALVQLLVQHPYQIIYEYDSKRKTDALTRVIVRGTRADKVARRAVTGSGIAAEAQTGRGKVGLKRANTASNPDDDQQIYLNQLLDPSPRVRAEAAENIEATGAALDYLTQLLLSDPAPEVRAAASHALQDSEDPKALDALTSALGESDPAVLIEVIDALGFVGNTQTISQLQPFLQNPNEDVRSAAQSSIDLLE